MRTPLTCDTRYGLCAKCYGRDLGRGSPGQRRRSGRRDRRAVDRRAGHAADDAYLPHRRRGIACGGGIAGRSQVERHGALHADHALRHQRARASRSSISRSGEVHHHRRQRPRARAPQGAVRRDAARSSRRRARSRPARRSPTGIRTTRPIITEYAGTVKFENVEEGVDRRQADRRGHRPVDPGRHRRRSAARRRRKGLRPQVKLINEAGEEVQDRRHRPRR